MVFLIASDMSLTSKPSWASKARAEEFRQLGVMASNLRTLAEWYVYYKLVNKLQVL